MPDLAPTHSVFSLFCFDLFLFFFLKKILGIIVAVVNTVRINLIISKASFFLGKQLREDLFPSGRGSNSVHALVKLMSSALHVYIISALFGC